MIKQFCKVALRNLGRQKALALINVLGLSVGLTCFIVFLLYAVNENSYDRFHKRGGDIYRVVEWAEGFPDREPGGSAGLSMAMAPAMAQDLPDVERYVRFRSRGNVLVKVGANVTRLGVSFADAPFFHVFSFPLLHGDPARVLDGPHSAVLTRDMAMRLFGSTDVVGRVIQTNFGGRGGLDTSYTSFEVTGVAENLPANSMFSFGILIGYPYLLRHSDTRSLTDWYQTAGDETFVMLSPGSTLPHDLQRLEDFRNRHLPDEARDFIKKKEWNGKGLPPVTFRLQPLTSIHTDPAIDGAGNPVNPRHIWLLIGMAAAVLLIACINFTTLSIGRSAGRAKEIGVRKVIGSKRRQLVVQFLAESLVLTVVSALLALGLTVLLLPYVSSLTGVALHLSFARFPGLAWMLGVLTLVTGLVAGAYPALVLSGFKPLEVLKSKVRLHGSNLFTRSLVVIQFVLSAGLLTATVIILQQVSFMRSRDLGFQKENVIDIDAADNPSVYAVYRQRVLSDPRVQGVTSADIDLGAGAGFMGGGCSFRGQGGGTLEYLIEPGYISVMGMKLLAGRDFRPALSTDSTHSVIVNQALLEEFHIAPDSAIGQVLNIDGMDDAASAYTIIGLIKDFNYATLSQKVRPQVFLWPQTLKHKHFYVRIAPGDPSGVLTFLGRTWSAMAPGLPFRYAFQDDEMNNLYATEARWSRIFGLAGGMSVFLACLGLFGLAALAAVNRHKEVSIRKVLGASVPGLVRLLSVEFSRLVLIALVIAAPLAWYLMHHWLQGYAFRIDIHWWVFAATGLVTLAVALLTVSLHALRAARANPVEGLRAE
ncbi:MAG TPA: ABC transporter permease [Dinghuibacter sp.]|uniref:ABC transporter permease n=1 Tax=Dinghuibacter sp. TaxID=2024697 RepID=UPI002C66ECB8|nr:ABC transporter permease [Dinghuibacter sp.]HTJ13606.1 ABC transporter permease [Dinghuibacter sp.]